MQVQQLKEQNRILKQKIHEFKQQKSLGPELRTQIQKFVIESKKNIKEMNERSVAEQQKSNQKLHQATQKYQQILKQQIALLTQNKGLTQKKDQQDQVFNQQVEKLTKEYEIQISQFQKKVKVNVKKIQDMGGNNIIKKLLKNDKFREAMAQKGCNLEGLEKQSQLQEIAQQVEQRQKEIEEAEKKSSGLDEQLQKMHELIETMRELMQNMQKQKQNILKQNTILKEKLQQSEGLIGKLLGGSVGEENEDDEQKAEDQQ